MRSSTTLCATSLIAGVCAWLMVLVVFLAVPHAVQASPFTKGAHSARTGSAGGEEQKDSAAARVFEEREAERAATASMAPSDGNPAHGQDAAAAAPGVGAQDLQPGQETQGTLPISPSISVSDTVSGKASGNAGGGIVATYYTRMLRTIGVAQRDMRQRMTVLGRDIAHNPGGTSFWMFVGLCFVYGVIHAIGPGHGKSVVFAYFLGRRGSMWRGFVMGHMLTFIHVLSAVLLVFGLRWLLNANGTQGFDAAGAVMQRVSYGLVVAIGSVMFLHALYELVSGKMASRACCTAAPEQADYRGILLVSTLTGLVPCPGAALVLAFALGLGIPAAGLAGVAALALGMGLTTSMFGMLSIMSRSTLVYVAGNGPRTLTILHGVLSLGGALVIALAGGMMLATAGC